MSKKNNNYQQRGKSPSKGHTVTFDKLSERMVLTILDMESMLPLMIRVPQVGATYEIIKTGRGLQMR